MSFKDWKLGTKLGFGFGLLILIAMILMIVVIINMFSVSNQASKMAEDYAPAIEVITKMENMQLQSMYDYGRFVLNEDDALYTEATGNFAEMKKAFEASKALAAKSKNLKLLSESITSLETGIRTYEGYALESKSIIDKIKSNRKSMDETLDKFFTEVEAYSNSQFEASKKDQNANEVRERVYKIDEINKIQTYGATILEEINRGQLDRDMSMIEGVQKYNEKIDDVLRKLKSVTTRQENLEQLTSIEEAADAYQTQLKELIANLKLKFEIAQKMTDAANNLLAVCENISNTGIKDVTNGADSSKNAIWASNIVIWIGTLLLLVIGIILAVVITGLIVSPIKKSVELTKNIALGDLTANIDIDQKDEVGILASSLKQMVEKLKHTIEGIVSGAQNIASASEQMSANSQEMSQGASEQASSTEEISSSMEEMASNIEQNTDNAQQTEKIAQSAMEGMRKVVDASQLSLSSIKDIANKIAIIDEIAFQTNILALNAAVEAARAGEYGKGFAVVAAEVRKLAERSKIAANEIITLSKQSVSVTEESAKLMEKLIPEVEKTAKLVQEITAASIEQNSGANQINNAIQQLNRVTQQNAASAEEMATSSEELSGQAEQLQDLVSFFKTGTLVQIKRKQMNFKKKSFEQNVAVNKHTGGVHLNLGKDEKTDNEFEKF